MQHQNATAGPSRQRQYSHSTSQEDDTADAVDVAGHGTGSYRPGEPNYTKTVRRSSKACLSCRVKKRKCGGVPPDPCPNCIRAEESCAWAGVDGRSSAMRKSKAKMVPDQSAEQHALLGQLQWPVGDMGGAASAWLQGVQMQPPIQDSFGGGREAIQTDSFGATDQYLFDFDYADPFFASPSQLGVNGNFLPVDQMLLSQPQIAQARILEQDASAWTGSMDPSDFVMALSSRLPTVEQAPHDGISPSSDSVPTAIRSDATGDTSAPRRKPRDRFVKVTWWRPHGTTAIAPGLKRMTLKVRVNEDQSDRASIRSPGTGLANAAPIDLFDGGRAPSLVIMRHLSPIFKEHFGSQFPFLDLDACMTDLEESNGSVFLLNCIAAVAARFSNHPSIALPTLKKHEYGNVFFDVAKSMLGSMLAVPLRETIIALLLLCHAGFANDSEAEEWMFAGMAVRLAVDLGIHLEPGEEQGISQEDRRLNRLTFWSVVLLDFALAFGTGRQPSIRVSEITQSLPTDADMGIVRDGAAHHPFPYAAQLMFSYGRLIELLNTRVEDAEGFQIKEMQKAKMQAIRVYGQLPMDMRWNVTNLQLHTVSSNAPIFLQLHLWFHTIIASGTLTGTDYLRRGKGRQAQAESGTGAFTPNGLAATQAWRHSTRTIGDILVLSDVVCPRAYAALPFCNQAFYVAGSCYVKELEQERAAREISPGTADGSHSASSQPGARQHDDPNNAADLFKSILATVSTENIASFRKGLAKQAVYWSGVSWVGEALEQRIQGIGANEIDLASVTEKLASIASIPDPGVLHRTESLQSAQS